MESNIISIVSVSTFIFWIFHVQRRVFFYLYFWQLKSYRIDRFLEEIKRNKSVLFPKICVPALILILFFNLPINTNLVFYLSAIFYLILGCRSFALIFSKKWKLPSFTKKMFFISVLVFIFLAILCFYFWRNIVIFILLLEILMPIFIFLSLGIIEIPANIFKRYLMFKARKKREKFKDLIVIGITGSYGKSSTKEFLYTMLSKKYGEDKVLKTEGNVNTEIGVANTVLKKLNNNHKFFICEMGAYKRGEIRTACNIVMPKIGIVTGINEQHLALFGSMENLMSAEGGEELIESLPKDGLMIFNGNNKYCLEMYQKTEKPKKIYQIPDTRYQIPSFAKVFDSEVFDRETQTESAQTRGASKGKLDTKADIWAKDIIIEKDCVRFKAVAREGKTTDFQVNVLGTHNVLNLLGAILVAKELGMGLGEIARAAEKIQMEQGAMRLIQSPTLNGFQSRTFNIIDSTYSANPDGVIADLEYLKVWQEKKAIIMPCLIELGRASKEVHQKIGAKIAQVCDLAIITSKDWFKELKESAIASGMNPESIIFSENPQEIFSKIKGFNSQEDVILLEGRVSQGLLDRFKNKTVPTI